jgi:hypothetical protein
MQIGRQDSVPGVGTGAASAVVLYQYMEEPVVLFLPYF